MMNMMNYEQDTDYYSYQSSVIPSSKNEQKSARFVIGDQGLINGLQMMVPVHGKSSCRETLARRSKFIQCREGFSVIKAEDLADEGIGGFTEDTAQEVLVFFSERVGVRVAGGQ